MNVSAEEMLRLSVEKHKSKELADDLRGFKTEELAIRVCVSPNSMIGSAHVGIEIAHKVTGIKVKSTEHKTQHQNKLNAIEALKLALVKERFENIDKDDYYLKI